MDGRTVGTDWYGPWYEFLFRDCTDGPGFRKTIKNQKWRFWIGPNFLNISKIRTKFGTEPFQIVSIRSGVWFRNQKCSKIEDRNFIFRKNCPYHGPDLWISAQRSRFSAWYGRRSIWTQDRLKLRTSTWGDWRQSRSMSEKNGSDIDLKN